MLQVADILAPGCAALAVASIEEAMAIREHGIQSPILLLEGFFQAEELGLIADHGFWSVVHNQKQLDALESASASLHKPLDVWLKIDTGMHRLGFSTKEVPSVYQQLKRLSSVGNIRFMTHFACADEPENSFTQQQIGCFDAAVGGYPEEKSLANSAAIIYWPQSHREWVRPGFMLYGLSPFGQSHPSNSELQPVMTFRTEVIARQRIVAGEGVGYNHHWRADKDTDIAVLAVGYGDGYPRNIQNGSPVMVNGQRARTVGRVAMDMMMVDITGLQGIEVGSEAELWGKNLSIDEVASYSGYSPYELLTRIPPRAHREYI